MSDLSQWRGKLLIATDLGQDCLEIDRGSVTHTNGQANGFHLEMPQDKLIQLMMGRRSIGDLAIEPDVSVSAEIIPRTGDTLSTWLIHMFGGSTDFNGRVVHPYQIFRNFSQFLQIFLTSAEIVSIINAIRVVTRKFLMNFLTFMRTMGIIKDNEIRYQLFRNAISNTKARNFQAKTIEYDNESQSRFRNLIFMRKQPANFIKCLAVWGIFILVGAISNRDTAFAESNPFSVSGYGIINYSHFDWELDPGRACCY